MYMSMEVYVDCVCLFLGVCGLESGCIYEWKCLRYVRRFRDLC